MAVKKPSINITITPNAEIIAVIDRLTDAILSLSIDKPLGAAPQSVESLQSQNPTQEAPQNIKSEQPQNPVQQAAPQGVESKQPQAPVQQIQTAPQMPVQQPQMPVQQPQMPVQQPQMPVQTLPIQITPYTIDQIMLAASNLMDSGKNPADFLFSKYQVQSLTQIPPERYGEVATDLRQMGAEI